MTADISEKKDRNMLISCAKGLGMNVLKPGRYAVIRLVGAFAILMALLPTGSAHADFRVCNATQGLIGAAIGYRAKSGWITEGWWHVKASSCETIIEGPLSSRYYYLYAEDAERGGRWSGPVDMCVADKEFKIFGHKDCYTRGFQRAGFQEYDTAEQSNWMVQLTDEPPRSSDSTQSENQ